MGGREGLRWRAREEQRWGAERIRGGGQRRTEVRGGGQRGTEVGGPERERDRGGGRRGRLSRQRRVLLVSFAILFHKFNET